MGIYGKNKNYAIIGAEILLANDNITHSESELWRLVMEETSNKSKQHNQ
ncbi:hypothetical protein QMA0440_01181 [Yersinia ruckeri]|nr:hypothetical protein QMA0440_01181 [Yersinia ruckeri]KFE37482.1 hypothetical protein nADLYRO1b_3142 [Yersinia ruckeri]